MEVTTGLIQQNVQLGFLNAIVQLEGNRVSLNVTLFGLNDIVHVSAITSGGSQAMIFKINTFGEEAFLDKVKEILGN